MPEITYLIGVCIFFTMGAGIALAFKEIEPKKAFFLGLSLPAMLQSGASDIAEQTSMIFQPVAYAYEEPLRKVEVNYDPEGPEFSFIFSADSKQRGREEVLLDNRETKHVDDGVDFIYIPPWASSFTVLILDDTRQQSESYPVLLLDTWKVKITPRPYRGLKQSVGLSGAKWDIDVSAIRGRRYRRIR